MLELHERPVLVAPHRTVSWRASAPFALALAMALAGAVLFGNPFGPVAAGSPARPTPREAASDVPLGLPAPLPPGSGRHAFSMHQEGSGDPVAYDPCRPVPVVINATSAPPGSTSLVQEALSIIGAATGLRFVVEGPSDEAPTLEDRPGFQPERYGDRWAPVLVAWSDPVAHPPLAGDVAGIGGSTAVTTEDAGWVYVTGAVVLDAPQLQEIGQRRGGYRQARAVIVHELAHVVGLDHVDDPTHLMSPTGSAVTDLHVGDLTGLAALGRGACADRL